MKRIVSVVLALAVMVFFVPDRGMALSAKSAVVINGDTGEIIYSHNCNIPLSMASTTKIMTALILCESNDLERQITVTAPMVAVEGSSMGLRVGDIVTLKDLLYGLMLPSGNDAANAIAIALGGSIEGFAQMMNNKAAELGLTNTHFVTPSGLDAEGHYTTAYELALITKQALSNEEFAKAVATKSITLNYGGKEHYLSNHNRLLSAVDGVVGVKTGYTKKSGRCLVSAYKKDGRYIITVTLNDSNDWADHKTLINIGVENIREITLTPNIKKFSLRIVGGNIKTAEIYLNDSSAFLLNDRDIYCEISLPVFLYAPQRKGEVIGKVCYYKENTLVLTEDILMPYDIEAIKQENSENFKVLFKEILSAV